MSPILTLWCLRKFSGLVPAGEWNKAKASFSLLCWLLSAKVHVVVSYITTLYFQEIENLEASSKLEELYLGKNKVSKLANIDTLTNLKILAVQSNRITVIGGLVTLVNLEQLYVSHNGIEKLENLDANVSFCWNLLVMMLRNIFIFIHWLFQVKLDTLDVAGNKIKTIEGLSHLAELKEFWVCFTSFDCLCWCGVPTSRHGSLLTRGPMKCLKILAHCSVFTHWLISHSGWWCTRWFGQFWDRSWMSLTRSI